MISIEKVGSVVSIAANITVVFSLIIALRTYFDQQAQEQRNVTRELISEFNSGSMLAAQMDFARELARLPTDALKNESIERDTVATLLRQVEVTSADSVGFQQNAILIVSFFDDTQSCVDSLTCSKEDVSLRLHEVATRYACLLIPYVEGIRENRLYSGLGDGLKRMVDYESQC